MPTPYLFQVQGMAYDFRTVPFCSVPGCGQGRFPIVPSLLQGQFLAEAWDSNEVVMSASSTAELSSKARSHT